MNILLNNQPEEFSERLTIKKLLEKRNIKSKYYAVEINRIIIPKSEHAQYLLKDGDKIEIITAIGGG
tara:strand:+ start:2312 stop:2512 length:201 start_codon:yes stop_codon:yes gene_type:complete